MCTKYLHLCRKVEIKHILRDSFYSEDRISCQLFLDFCSLAYKEFQQKCWPLGDHVNSSGYFNSENVNTWYTTDSYFIYLFKIEYRSNLWVKVSIIICTYQNPSMRKWSFLLLNLQYGGKILLSWSKRYFLKNALRMEGYQKYFLWTTFYHYF